MNKWKGSLTVEASLIVPMVTFIVIGLLCLIFFYHDQVVMWSDAMAMAEKAAFTEEGEVVDTKSVLIMARRTDHEAFREKEAGKGIVGGRFRIPVSGTAVFTGSRWEASYTVTFEHVDYMKDRWEKLLKEGERSGDHLQ